MKIQIDVEQFFVRVTATYEDGKKTRESMHFDHALGMVEDLRCPVHARRIACYFHAFGLDDIAEEILEHGPALADALEKAAHEAQEAYADHLKRIARDEEAVHA